MQMAHTFSFAGKTLTLESYGELCLSRTRREIVFSAYSISLFLTSVHVRGVNNVFADGSCVRVLLPNNLWLGESCSCFQTVCSAVLREPSMDRNAPVFFSIRIAALSALQLYCGYVGELVTCFKPHVVAKSLNLLD